MLTFTRCSVVDVVLLMLMGNMKLGVWSQFIVTFKIITFNFFHSISFFLGQKNHCR